MAKVDFSQQLLIGKSISRTASVNTLDPNNASFLADGEVVVLDENDQVMTAGTTYATSKYIKIVQRSGATASTAQVVQSARIDGANVIAFKGLSYAAPQEQISYIGYDGSSGSIDDTQTSDYLFRITMKHNKDVWSHQVNTHIARFTPTSTSNQSDIVDYLAPLLSDNEYLSAEVSIERLANVLSVAGGDAGITWTFTTGSKTVTKTGGAGAVVANDYVRAVAIAGDATTVPVYKVLSSTATSVTLDQEFQGTSAAFVAPAYILAATANLAATNLGLRFTGKSQSFTVLKFHYVKVKFEFQLSGWGTTTTSYSQNSVPGSGAFEQVSELEQRSIVYEGAVDRTGSSAPTGRNDAVSSAVYDIISLEFFHNYSTPPVSGARPTRASLFLAMVDGAAQTTNVLAVLNPWLASAPGSFPNVTV